MPNSPPQKKPDRLTVILVMFERILAFTKHIITQKLTEFIYEFILHNRKLKLPGKSVQDHHSLTIFMAQHFPRWLHMVNKFELHHGRYNPGMEHSWNCGHWIIAKNHQLHFAFKR